MLEADQHSKVVMTFTLLNKVTSDPVTVHQVCREFTEFTRGLLNFTRVHAIIRALA